MKPSAFENFTVKGPLLTFNCYSLFVRKWLRKLCVHLFPLTFFMSAQPVYLFVRHCFPSYFLQEA